MLQIENIIAAVITALAVVIVTYVIYCKWVFRYWKRMNLECFEDPTIPFGNGMWMWRDKITVPGKIVYDLIKRKGLDHAGSYICTVPMYIPRNPDILKKVLQNDFEFFSQRLCEDNTTYDAFAANLAMVTGDRWSYLRGQLTPAFTPAKIRMLFDGILKCAHQMQKALDGANKEAFDVTKMATCYFADVVGVSAYGLHCNSFKDPNWEFIYHAKNLIQVPTTYRCMKVLIKVFLPKLAEWLRISIYPKESTDFFINFAKDAAKFRKKNIVVRKDLFQLMLDAETELNVEEMEDDTSNSAKIIKDMASQVFLFFVAGFETSTVSWSYCLYELAKNLDVQCKLREEIDTVLMKYEGNITYDAVMEMTYLSKVVDETLRKYPPVPVIPRRCVKDYQIHGTTIEKGILASILIAGVHHDPDYYPDPEKFDPERFSEENKQKRIPFTYLPFGGGPRNCPAYRFGLMQIKVGLVVLLQHYTLSVNKTMKFPLELNAYSITMSPKSAIILDIKNRNTHEP